MFKEQATTDIFAGSLLYFIGTVGVVLAIVAFLLIDYGSVRSKNALDTVVQSKRPVRTADNEGWSQSERMRPYGTSRP